MTFDLINTLLINNNYKIFILFLIINKKVYNSKNTFYKKYQNGECKIMSYL